MNVAPISKYIRGTIKIVVGVLLFSIVGIAVLLGLLWLDHNRETTLPTPTGLFAVGRTMYAWSEAAQLARAPKTPSVTARTSLFRDILT